MQSATLTLATLYSLTSDPAETGPIAPIRSLMIRCVMGGATRAQAQLATLYARLWQVHKPQLGAPLMALAKAKPATNQTELQSKTKLTALNL